MLGAWSFLALVPRVGGWFTRMGAATLVVYLFHGFVIKGAEYAGYMGWAEDHAAVSLVLTTLAAAGLALLLAWRRWRRVLNHAVDPFGYAERHVEAGGPARADGAGAGRRDRASAIEEAVADGAAVAGLA